MTSSIDSSSARLVGVCALFTAACLLSACGSSAPAANSAAGAGAVAGSAGQGSSTAGADAGGASTAGAGGASALSGCSGKTYKLCEDFETGTVGSLPSGWTAFEGYGVSSPQDQALASDQFHSGAHALKSISAAKGASRIQKSIASLGATASKHWGRIFYKVQSPAAMDNANVLHTTFVSVMGTSENRIVDTVEAQSSNQHQWLFNNPNDQGGTASAYDWTFDAAWHCAEWYVDVSSKSYRFFHDGQEVTALAFTGVDNQMSNYTAIILGATYYQNDPLTSAFTLWLDDLAIDDTQIGCN